MMVFYMSALLAKRSDLPKYQFICIHIITSTHSIIPFLYTYVSSCSKFLCKSSSLLQFTKQGLFTFTVVLHTFISEYIQKRIHICIFVRRNELRYRSYCVVFPSIKVSFMLFKSFLIGLGNIPIFGSFSRALNVLFVKNVE